MGEASRRGTFEQRKERSMAWHTIKLSRTEEEFNLWWKKNSKTSLALDKLLYNKYG